MRGKLLHCQPLSLLSILTGMLTCDLFAVADLFVITGLWKLTTN